MCLAEVGKNEGEKHHAYIEAESRTVVARGWGAGIGVRNRERLANRYNRYICICPLIR